MWVMTGLFNVVVTLWFQYIFCISVATHVTACDVNVICQTNCRENYVRHEGG